MIAYTISKKASHVTLVQPILKAETEKLNSEILDVEANPFKEPEFTDTDFEGGYG